MSLIFVLLPPPNNKNLASIHGQKCLWGNCGIQPHVTGPEKSHPPVCWVNRQILVPAVDPAMAHPLSHSLGTPRKHYLRQSPMDMRAFAELQVSRWEISAHHWREKEKKMHLEALECIRVSAWLYPHHPSSKVTQLRAERDLDWWYLLWGKGKVCESVPVFPSCMECYHRG